MRLPAPQWCALPPSLLLLVASWGHPSVGQQGPRPRDLSVDFKYFPEHEHIFRREEEIQQKLQWHRPAAVRKMSGDPGEKFYLDYWIFEEGTETITNHSALAALSNSLRVHGNLSESRFVPRHLDPRGLSKLFKRDFECPAGSSACTSIDRPNSCCEDDSTCQRIADTGYGDVGCCPSGQSCGGTLSGCGSDSTDCPNDGGGCCLPGYACYQEGCVQTATTTLLVAPSTSQAPETVTVTAVTTISQSNGEPSTVTTTVIIGGSPTGATTEQTSAPTTSGTSESPSSTDCPANYRTCPESLGGGCCHTDRACGTGNLCPASTSSGLQPPNRPTSGDVTTTTAESLTTPSGGAGCPTGYYGCKAFHQGGCCQTGRDCDTTSCPPIDTTVVIDTGGVTVDAPTGVTGSVPSGTCRDGWFSCNADLGGGCCPTGYGCEVATCTATALPSGQDHSVGKIAPESSATWSKEMDWAFMVVAGILSSAALGLGMML